MNIKHQLRYQRG